jgi:hypothetical protein
MYLLHYEPSDYPYCKIIGHIHKQGTQKDYLMKKWLQKTILDFYCIYYFIIIVDCYMINLIKNKLI